MARPITSVGTCMSAMLRTKAPTSAGRVSPSTGTPVVFSSWPTIMMMATPHRYPTRIGCDSRSETKPSRRIHATIAIPPTTRARVAARAANCGGVAGCQRSDHRRGHERGRRLRTLPTADETSRARRRARAPAGSPTGRRQVPDRPDPAYAMTCGTRYAATVIAGQHVAAQPAALVPSKLVDPR